MRRPIDVARKLAGEFGWHIAQAKPGQINGYTVMDRDGRLLFRDRTAVECRAWLLGISWTLLMPRRFIERARRARGRDEMTRVWIDEAQYIDPPGMYRDEHPADETPNDGGGGLI